MLNVYFNTHIEQQQMNAEQSLLFTSDVMNIILQAPKKNDHKINSGTRNYEYIFNYGTDEDVKTTKLKI